MIPAYLDTEKTEPVPRQVAEEDEVEGRPQRVRQRPRHFDSCICTVHM